MTIGKKVAGKLDIPCYDYEIITEIAKRVGWRRNTSENAVNILHPPDLEACSVEGTITDTHSRMKCADMICELY